MLTPASGDDMEGQPRPGAGWGLQMPGRGTGLLGVCLPSHVQTQPCPQPAGCFFSLDF